MIIIQRVCVWSVCTCTHVSVRVSACMNLCACVRACMNLYIYITTVLMPLTHDEDTSLKVSSTSEVVLCFFPRVTLNCSRLYRYTNSVCLTTQHTDIRTCMWTYAIWSTSQRLTHDRGQVKVTVLAGIRTESSGAWAVTMVTHGRQVVIQHKGLSTVMSELLMSIPHTSVTVRLLHESISRWLTCLRCFSALATSPSDK